MGVPRGLQLIQAYLPAGIVPRGNSVPSSVLHMGLHLVICELHGPTIYNSHYLLYWQFRSWNKKLKLVLQLRGAYCKQWQLNKFIHGEGLNRAQKQI